MSHSIRKATVEDVIQISNLYVTNIKSAYKGIFNDGFLAKLTPESRYDQWEKNIKNPNNIVLVIETDDKIVGMIVGTLIKEKEKLSNAGNILAVNIDPTYKERGFGRKLVFALFEEFKKLGITQCTAKVFKNNEYKGFFEHLGGTLIKEQAIDEAQVLSVFIYRWDTI